MNMLTEKIKVAIVEDDLDLQEVMKEFLESSGFDTFCFNDSEQFFAQASFNQYDAFLVDRKLPGRSGLEVVRALKAKRISGPIIMVTGQSEPNEVVEGLEAGADDYITKPFHYQVLAIKIRNLVERFRALSTMREPLRLINGERLQLLENSLELKSGDERVRFTRTEFQIFCPLFLKLGLFVKRESLFEGDSLQKSRSLDVHVAAIRKKIRPFGLDLETLRGVGYRLVEPDSQAEINFMN
ncbi:MAG: hypothetical protein CL676_11905 [Bdellovibrionaceae bacterium]|nr:hypothetical protein [Pseudobdellovibrionaceae bacterium]|tara:strand:+ start:1900 stop:2619 length:720 start_codon:yes stop_codon:yes gene_type:complete